MAARGGAAAVRCLLGIVLLAVAGIAHCAEDPFVKWAAAHATPIATLESSADFSDLQPLTSVVGAARVVALGEPTHGAHEPLAFRNRLIHFLVEKMGFTAVALESGFTESSAVDSFVAGGPGEAQGVIRDGMTSGKGSFDENRELVQWMRDSNAAATADRHRIRFYGIDLTAGGRVSGPRRALDFSLAFLSRSAAADADKIGGSLASLPRRDDGEFGSLSQTALTALDGGIAAIATAMAKNRNSLIAHSSAEEYRWALQNLNVARQLARYFHVMTPRSNQDMHEAGPVIAARDYAMAENLRWVVDSQGPGGRVVVFAHNNHVMNWKEEGGYWAGMREKPLMMGSHMRRAYGKHLLIIATSSMTAAAGLPSPEPIEDSIDSTLARVGMPRMFLDLRLARQDPAALAWLGRQRSLHANISSHVVITPATAVDAFVFLSELTPALGTRTE
jgi:erythromycin esterase